MTDTPNATRMFRPIPGYESQYCIDHEGNVYSMGRTVITGVGDGYRTMTPKILKTFINSKNQVCVQLYKNNKKSTFAIKTLMKQVYG